MRFGKLAAATLIGALAYKTAKKYLKENDEHKSEELVNEAVEDLKKKLEQDKDEKFTIMDVMRNIQQNKLNSGLEALRTHLGDEIVFTALWKDAEDEHEVKDYELLEGELSAVTFKVGCYMIRSSQKLYLHNKENHYTERIPASKEEIEEYHKNCERLDMLYGLPTGEVRRVHEISAKYIGGDTTVDSQWQFICLAAESTAWSESIDFIGTVKKQSSVSDEQAVLFVLKEFIGSSYSVSHWHKFTSNGEVTGYTEHPYNPESFKEPWDLD